MFGAQRVTGLSGGCLADGNLWRSASVLCVVACAQSVGIASYPHLEQGMDTAHNFDSAASAYDHGAALALQDAQDKLAKLETYEGPPAGILAPLNELGIVLDRALCGAALTRAVHPDSQMRDVATRYEQAFSKVGTLLGLSRPLYQRLGAINLGGLDATTKRYVGHMLRDFRRAGVDKDAATQARITALRQELVDIGQQFEKNIREDVRQVRLEGVGSLAGLPQDYISKHPPLKDGHVVLTTDYPDYLPFMSYAQNDAARKELYLAFRKRGYPQNETVLHQLLCKRHTLAQLLGYSSWAAYVIEDKMMGSADAAQTFIDKINALVTMPAKNDVRQLLHRLQRDNPRATTVGDWQKTYIEEAVKREDYQFDAQAARAFFPFAQVRQGLFEMVHQMFGVTIRPIEATVWHPSVKAYELCEGDQVIGRFFLDLHPRPDKYKHAAAFPIVAGVKDRQLPQAALVCNFPEGDDALMEHDEVQTFFHEFGHLLHHLFAGAQPYIAQSGIATEWDFVEAPSQMLEEWTFDADTLKSFARDAQGRVIDDKLIFAMRRARDFGKGLWVKQQMFYAALSLQIHSVDPTHLVSTDLVKDLQARYAPFAYVPDTYFQLSFGHLEGYSAIYYTYMWSLVIAKDLFDKFRQDGLLNAATAARYRQTVLAPGGSKDARDLVQDFLGRPFCFDAFARWVNEN